VVLPLPVAVGGWVGAVFALGFHEAESVGAGTASLATGKL